MAEVLAVKSFGYPQFLRVRVTGVEPGFFIEPGVLDHQRVSLPMPDGIALPRGIGIFRQRTAVGKNLAKSIELRNKPDDAWGLEDLEHTENHIGADPRQAAIRGTILAQVFQALLVELLRPGLDFGRF